MSQNDRILRYLKRGRKLTALRAMDLFGSMRLAARIWELRRKGHPIKEETVERNGKRFAEYRMG